MSAAEMSSEGGTRSHPRGGLYVFVPCSQFPKGGGGRDRDERVQRHERDRVVEPPCVEAGCGPPLPIRVERNLERPRQIRVFHDQADLAILRRRTERPVHARDEDRAAVCHGAFVVQTFDGPGRLEQSDLEGETLVPCKPIDAIEHVIVRPRVGLDRGPAPVEEDSHGDPATGRGERGFEKRIRRVAPYFVEIERGDREAHLRGGEQAEDSLRVERRVRRQDNPGGPRRGGRPGGPRDDGWCMGQREESWFPRGNGIRPPWIEVGLEDVPENTGQVRASTITDQPRLPSWSGENPAVPKFSEPIQAARRSTRAYFAWR